MKSPEGETPQETRTVPSEQDRVREEGAVRLYLAVRGVRPINAPPELKEKIIEDFRARRTLDENNDPTDNTT